MSKSCPAAPLAPMPLPNAMPALAGWRSAPSPPTGGGGGSSRVLSATAKWRITVPLWSRIGMVVPVVLPIWFLLRLPQVCASSSGASDLQLPPSAKPPLPQGLFCLPSAALDAIGVYRAAIDGVIEIPPPAVRANIVKLALASHPAEVESPIRRALVRQYHQREPIHARNGRSCTPQSCAHSAIPPTRRAKLSAEIQYTPLKAGRQERFDFLCLLQRFALLPAYEPVEGGGWVYPRRVCDGGELGEIRKRWALRILPGLPGRAGNPRKPCGLRLAQIAEPPEMLQARFDGLPILSRRAAAEYRPLCVRH